MTKDTLLQKYSKSGLVAYAKSLGIDLGTDDLSKSQIADLVMLHLDEVSVVKSEASSEVVTDFKEDVMSKEISRRSARIELSKVNPSSALEIELHRRARKLGIHSVSGSSQSVDDIFRVELAKRSKW